MFLGKIGIVWTLQKTALVCNSEWCGVLQNNNNESLCSSSSSCTLRMWNVLRDLHGETGNCWNVFWRCFIFDQSHISPCLTVLFDPAVFVAFCFQAPAQFPTFFSLFQMLVKFYFHIHAPLTASYIYFHTQYIVTFLHWVNTHQSQFARYVQLISTGTTLFLQAKKTNHGAEESYSVCTVDPHQTQTNGL